MAAGYTGLRRNDMINKYKTDTNDRRFCVGFYFSIIFLIDNNTAHLNQKIQRVRGYYADCSLKLSN